MDRKVFVNTLALITVLQLVMVLAGHWIPFVSDSLFAPLGTFISLLGGVQYVRLARPAWVGAWLAGAVIGGVSALIGIVVSVLLKDTAASTLMIGTAASTVAGLFGASFTRVFVKP